MNDIEPNGNIYETFYCSGDLEHRLELLSHKIFPLSPSRLTVIDQMPKQLNHFNLNREDIKTTFEFINNNSYEVTPPLNERKKSNIISVSEGGGGCLNKNRKKSIRFADELGLELAKVKYINDPETPPYIPKKLLNHLMHASEISGRAHVFTKNRTDLIQNDTSNESNQLESTAVINPTENDNFDEYIDLLKNDVNNTSIDEETHSDLVKLVIIFFIFCYFIT
jgi:hypothetical protein